MGRKKPVPTKRPRQEDEPEHQDEPEQPELLIERLEVQQLRGRIADGTCVTVDNIYPRGTLPAGLAGLCQPELSATDLAILRQLHRTIVTRLQGKLTGWGTSGL